MKFSYLFYEPIVDIQELDRRLGELAELGYDGVELSAFHPMPYPIESVAKLAEKHKLPVVSMLSGWSYSSEKLCLSSIDSEVRKRAALRLIDYVGQAAVLKCLIVVGMMQGVRADEPDGQIANDRIAEGLGLAGAAAEKAKVSLLIEPVNHLQVGFNNTIAEASALANRVGSPSLGYMLDTFHMNIEERSVVEATREHSLTARHVHLCETNGGRFGTGGLNFQGVLSTLVDTDYTRFVSIKVYRGAGWKEEAEAASAFLQSLGYGNFARASR